MPFNASGVFERLYSWIADRDNGVKIRADRMEEEMNGFKDAINTITANDFPMRGSVRGTAGSETNPAYTFDVDRDTGMFRPDADTIGLVAGGKTSLNVKRTGLDVDGTVDANRFLGTDGTSTAPTHTFADDPDTGLSRYEKRDENDVEYDGLALSTGGQNRLTLDEKGTEFTVPVNVSAENPEIRLKDGTGSVQNSVSLKINPTIEGTEHGGKVGLTLTPSDSEKSDLALVVDPDQTRGPRWFVDDDEYKVYTSADYDIADYLIDGQPAAVGGSVTVKADAADTFGKLQLQNKDGDTGLTIGEGSVETDEETGETTRTINFNIAEGTNCRMNGAYDFSGDVNFDWSKVNDGADSGLDADTVDGLHASQFVRSDADSAINGVLNLQAESGLNLRVGYNSGGLPDKYIGFYRGGTTRTGVLQALSDRLRLHRDYGATLDLHGTHDARINGSPVLHTSNWNNYLKSQVAAPAIRKTALQWVTTRDATTHYGPGGKVLSGMNVGPGKWVYALVFHAIQIKRKDGVWITMTG